MNPLTLPLRLPLLPVTGILKLGEVVEEEVVRLAQVIGEEAERQLHDPARIRRELEAAQRRRDSGEISDAELAQIQDRLAATMVSVPTPPTVTRSNDDGS